jgi:hypothetical protein
MTASENPVAAAVMPATASNQRWLAVPMTIAVTRSG